MDGWITIGTKLDTKQFDAQLKQQEKQLKDYEKEADKLATTKSKLEVNLDAYEKEKKLIQETTDNLLSKANTEEQVANVLKSEAMQLEQLKEQYSDQFKKVDDINRKIEENATNQKMVRGEIAKTTDEIKKVSGIKQVNESINGTIENANKGMSGVLKKVAKWGLAVFSVRSAYQLIRSSISTITQYDTQLAKDIEYIRYAVAMTIKPIVEWLVNAVYKIMYYVNYIANAWFGINIFENSGIDNFNKGLNKANKQSKELKKTLMGFDEVNVLQDTSDSGEKITTPSFDLSKMNQVPIPDWVEWIARNKDLIIELASIVGIAFGTGKTLEILSNISKIFGVSGPLGAIGGTGLSGLMSSLLAITAIAGGIVVIVSIAKYIWDDLDKLEKQVARISETNQKINQEVTKNIEPSSKVETLTDKMSVNIQSGKEELKKSNDWWVKIRGNASQYLQSARNVAENAKVNAEKAKEMWEYEGRTRTEKRKIIEALKEQWEYNLDVIATLEAEGQNVDELKQQTQELKFQIDGYNRELNKTEKIWWTIDGNVTQTTDDVEALNRKKIQDKTFSINAKGNGAEEVDKITLALAKTKIMSLSFANLPGIKGVISNMLTTSTLSGLVKLANKYGIKFATGGIVNMPNRGVPIGGNVFAGESGKEGVIPLTDPTAMSALGQEIGKWVNIGIENNMVVDGRVLASATNNQINKESFLMNR